MNREIKFRVWDEIIQPTIDINNGGFGGKTPFITKLKIFFMRKMK